MSIFTRTCIIYMYYLDAFYLYVYIYEHTLIHMHVIICMHVYIYVIQCPICKRVHMCCNSANLCVCTYGYFVPQFQTLNNIHNAHLYSLSHTHTHSLFLSLSLWPSLSRTRARALSLSLCCSHTHRTKQASVPNTRKRAKDGCQ